jgi:hypothetical protein
VRVRECEIMTVEVKWPTVLMLVVDETEAIECVYEWFLRLM